MGPFSPCLQINKINIFIVFYNSIIISLSVVSGKKKRKKFQIGEILLDEEILPDVACLVRHRAFPTQVDLSYSARPAGVLPGQIVPAITPMLA